LKGANSVCMKFIPFILILGLLAGCSTDDARLHGTWQSNREATVAAVFQQTPSLTNLPPENIERLKDLYGHLTMTYSNGMATSNFRGKKGSWHYRVIEKGNDFVVIRNDEAPSDWRDARIHFVDGNKSYWVQGYSKHDERFDKVEER